MSRLALGIEYDGTAYSGWQAQDHAPSVQAAVENALAQIAQHPVSVTASGRTDAGVHALAQVIHCDVAVERPLRAWVRGVNAHLPSDIGVRWARAVDEHFDARRSAQARRYRYILCAQPTRPVLHRHRVGWTYKSLCVTPMQQAATCLIGEHDFSSFRAAGCQAKHPVRNIHALSVSAVGSLIHIDIEANAFIHHMVRNIVGTLIPIGAGEQSAAWLGEVLAARDRTQAGITAAAAGLYLVGARYPVGFGLPEIPQPPAFACLRGEG